MIHKTNSNIIVHSYRMWTSIFFSTRDGTITAHEVIIELTNTLLPKIQYIPNQTNPDTLINKVEKLVTKFLKILLWKQETKTLNIHMNDCAIEFGEAMQLLKEIFIGVDELGIYVNPYEYLHKVAIDRFLTSLNWPELRNQVANCRDHSFYKLLDNTYKLRTKLLRLPPCIICKIRTNHNHDFCKSPYKTEFEIQQRSFERNFVKALSNFSFVNNPWTKDYTQRIYSKLT